jgi:superfamily II DNA or RNA helicase
VFLAAPAASKGSRTQYAGRILRSHENKTTAEVHDHLDERTGVLAAMLAQPRIGLHRPRASPTHASSHLPKRQHRPLTRPANQAWEQIANTPTDIQTGEISRKTDIT